jgi:hypothetical protein
MAAAGVNAVRIYVRPPWIPLEGQRHEWLADATGLAEELGL